MKWAVLSDLHMNFKNCNTVTARDKLIETLRKENTDGEISFVLITGDCLHQNEMADAINEGLKEYATLASTEVKKAVRKSAKTVKEQIQSGAPSRTGRYKESWVATKQSESSQSLQMVVHSKNRYQLAHLLEKGHAKRGGGRVAGRPHIAPAEQAGIEQLQSLIEKALK